jgi:AbrB family looped-hinge helix DNA binding protein
MSARKGYAIQENGQVTLPAEWRAKHHLQKGDIVSFVETEQGLLVVPREVAVMQALDDIGAALKEKGITLEEIMARGREIRAQMLKEEYGLDAEDDD